MIVMVSSCTPKDSEINKAVTAIAQTVAPGVHVHVEDGVVTFTGTFPDSATRVSLDSVVTQLKGVISVEDHAALDSSQKR